MFVRPRALACIAVWGFCFSASGHLAHSQDNNFADHSTSTNQRDSAEQRNSVDHTAFRPVPNDVELIYFYDETVSRDSSSASAVKYAVENGFRIREVAARRFPNLAKRFRILKLPSLILLRRNRLDDRHDGRFTFPRIREMFAKARENRIARRDKIREFIAGSGNRANRLDAPPSIPPTNAPIAPRYIHTMTQSPDRVETTTSVRIPKPLDRNGRFAVSHVPSLAEQTAFNATVRLRVIDPSGTSHGTGTIIHSQGTDALVLTCGHIFRESKGRGRIEADVLFAEGGKTVSGKLITYDSRAHDVALLTLKTHKPIPAAKLASRQNTEAHHADVFTVGCDKGNSPTIRRSHFKRSATYDGVEKYDVYGRPIDGRSGGGLFNQRGELIGVCNAAAVHIDEGIYSGLQTIYHQLKYSHLAHLFDSPRNDLLDNVKSQFAQTDDRKSNSGRLAANYSTQNPDVGQRSQNEWTTVQQPTRFEAIPKNQTIMPTGTSRPQNDLQTQGVRPDNRLNATNLRSEGTRTTPLIPQFHLSSSF